MIAVKFLVWVFLNLFFVVFVAVPGSVLFFVIAPIYYAWNLVTDWLPGFVDRAERWLD